MIFDKIANELENYINNWEPKLLQLKENVITTPVNNQNRSIKQIVGHMIDSVSNNTHRVVYFQYEKLPLEFPNYATYGNNDKWIAIQNYREENWENLVQLWKFTHLHFIHIIKNINPAKLNAKWNSGKNEFVSLQEMVEDFPRHFKLHLGEIEELLHL